MCIHDCTCVCLFVCICPHKKGDWLRVRRIFRESITYYYCYNVNSRASLPYIVVYTLQNILGAPVAAEIFPGIHSGFIIYLYVLYVSSSMSIHDIILVELLDE